MKRSNIALPLLLVGAWVGIAEAKANERKSIYPGKNWRCTSGVLGNRLSQTAHDGREREFIGNVRKKGALLCERPSGQQTLRFLL